MLTLIILAAIERILQTEAQARQKADQLRLTLEHMSQGIMLVTKDLQIPIINGRCAELLDLPAELIDNPPRFDQLVKYQSKTTEPPDAAPAQQKAPIDQPVPHLEAGEFAVSERKMPNGSVIEVRSGQLPDGSLVQTFTDITKRCEAEAHVARLASEDPLTGLPNRRVFGTALDQVGQRHASTTDPASGFAVLFLDLDRFKFVNDTLGHRIGDLLLQEVARAAETITRSNGSSCQAWR